MFVLPGKLKFLFVNQSYLVKGAKLRYIYVRGFILQLKMASASVVNFCVTQKELNPRNRREEGMGLSVVDAKITTRHPKKRQP